MMTGNPTYAPPKGGVVAYLCVEGALKASHFYQQAFGAQQVGLYPPDEQGRTMHVHLYVNGSSLMLSDPYPEHGCGYEKAAGFNLALMVADVDTAFQRAVEAGAAAVMPPTDMFWGDRYAQARDPFGVLWAFNGPQKA
ncbi:MAG TPA: VOC family protein [Rhizomicrobium sp.]|nr:VOC family protein [Rhizomicrobium sp.]